MRTERIEFIDATLAEVDEALSHYESIDLDLGICLREEVGRYADFIRRNPLVTALRAGGYRRVNLRTFPYYFAYIIHEETIWVLAFGHHARRPEYWRGREGEVFRQ